MNIRRTIWFAYDLWLGVAACIGMETAAIGYAATGEIPALVIALVAFGIVVAYALAVLAHRRDRTAQREG